MLKHYANAITPKPKEFWLKLTNKDRMEIILNKTKDNQKFSSIKPNRVTKDGQVFLNITENLSASKRGLFLLEYESYLKDEIDHSINVWCEPIGDKNSLRNLRGIKIKA